MEEYDIIIIGAGPAGLTAGLYAGREGQKTLLLDKGLVGGLGLEVPIMENYPGFEIVNGTQLINKMKKQTEKVCKIQHLEEVNTITPINKTPYNFQIITTKSEYYAKSIILATGSKRKKLNIPGEKEYLGRGISYCATCDGPFFKDKNIFIVGGGNSAVQEAIYLKQIGCNVTLVHRRDTLRADKYLQDKLHENRINILYNSQIKEIQGEIFVNNTIIEHEQDIIEKPIDGVFIAIGDEPANKLAEELDLELDDKGYIITDKEQKTNLKHVYAAGDVTGGIKQWVVSCGEGAVASSVAHKEII